MITIWMTYVLAAMAASGVFVVAGWRSKHARGVAAARNWEGLPIDPLWGQEEAHFDVSDVPADAGAAIRLVLKRLAPVMASQSVQAEIAAASGLLVRMKGAALAELLEELLTAAIHNAPASRLLMTATKRVDRIYISITDDMPGADPAVRLGSIRGLMERVALRGGTLDVNVRPAEGTTMTLRLAALSENDAPVLEPAAGAAVRADGLALRAER